MGLGAAPPPLWPRPQRALGTCAGPRDPHSVLGVRPEATPSEIRAAFLQRCKEVHPDRDPGDPTRHGRFLRVVAAYEALSPPPAPPAPARGGPRAPPHTPPPPYRADPNRRYWDQFRPPRSPPRPPPPPHVVLGLCLLLGGLGMLVHGLAYRYVAGAHAAFLDQRDRALRAAWERARSRAGPREEVLQRLRAARRRRERGGGGR